MWVFKYFLQTDIDDADVTFSGRVSYSTVGQQRPEKLDRRWLKEAMMSMQSGDADEDSVAILSSTFIDFGCHQSRVSQR